MKTIYSYDNGKRTKVCDVQLSASGSPIITNLNINTEKLFYELPVSVCRLNCSRVQLSEMINLTVNNVLRKNIKNKFEYKYIYDFSEGKTPIICIAKDTENDIYGFSFLSNKDKKTGTRFSKKIAREKAVHNIGRNHEFVPNQEICNFPDSMDKIKIKQIIQWMIEDWD